MDTLAFVIAPGILPGWLYVAEWFFLIFGIIMIAGGLMGFLKAGSMASLVAGGIAGLVFVISALLVPKEWHTWLAIDLIVCLLLLGRFFPALLRRKYNPASYVVPLAIIGAIVALINLTLVLQP